MATIHLSKRLQAIADCVESGERVADIGTDHAFLPMALAQSGKIDFALACDVGEGPIAIAKQNIEVNGLQNVVQTRLADGLEGLRTTDGISTVVIAGMGGELIAKILTRGRKHLDGTETLVLSPHRDVPIVRQWLADNDYGIVSEKMLEDEGHVYTVMVAGRTKPDVPYTPADIEFGPILRQERSELFVSELRREEKTMKNILAGLKAAQHLQQERIAATEARLALVQKELEND
ncbi:tRNA (adenine(22)-N(1))-methyltransferase [Lacticaseibacillus hulanensis]|uniref:tRNA (adenine(22)-N(1))-methyltransferase n=1 Tax=Lacticaseibacillus hulanensis TaxID=2493111 RepID=UPI000FDC38BC|nr:class I SAM-dependent methyltransferase [Lacticaseibacillus hulanensis]